VGWQPTQRKKAVKQAKDEAEAFKGARRVLRRDLKMMLFSDSTLL
jgi:ribosome recycling factor